MSKLRITVNYASGHREVYEADTCTTEFVQWRLRTRDLITLIPMTGVYSLVIEENP